MKRAAAALSTPIALVSTLLLLAGCAAGQHQIVDASETCASCHSEEKPVYEWGTEVPAGAVESAASVTVKAEASSIVVCRPVFTAQDGSSYVPEKVSSVSLADGQAVVELEDGLWALCVDEGDAARAKLVHVGSEGSEGVVVEL